MSSLGQFLQSYRDAKIAIYGLSPLTKKLLAELSGYQVVGLLDGYRINGTLYGKAIRTLEEVIQDGVRLIIVAARPESCKVIAKRIGSVCKEHEILIVDPHGKDLCAPKEAIFHFRDMKEISKKQFAHFINEYDVISVDVFDTLLMRRTLFPTDVFEIVGLRLRQKGVKIEKFSQKRLEAEKELMKHTVPTLREIYVYILEKYPDTAMHPEELERLEWETDRALAVPRKELCQMLQEASQRGKKIYVVSDTFYTKTQLAGLLENCGITWYEDILSSCDYQTSKTQQLFEVLRDKVAKKSCLHIGDSIDADIESAKRIGFAACQLYSGLELFENLEYLGLWDQIQSLPDRIQVGMLVSHLFNSPFQFERKNSKIHVDNAYEIGYLFCAPIICDFVIWLSQRVQDCGLKNIWFCARDGYLIQKLYKQLKSSRASNYFLTSRTAAIRAGMENEDDICYVEEMNFSGSIQEQLHERFGIAVEPTDKRGKLREYAEEILAAAAVNREHYRTYLLTLECAGEDVAFFDFVARGTVQMYVSRITAKKLKGFYFLQQDEEYMQKYGLDIEAFYRKGDPAGKGLEGNYYILETILTSPAPSVVGFDCCGEALYREETRTEKDIAYIQAVQDGIEEYVRTYLNLCPEQNVSGNKQLGERILALIHNVDIRDDDFLHLNVEDTFFNRITNISNLL